MTANDLQSTFKVTKAAREFLMVDSFTYFEYDAKMNL